VHAFGFIDKKNERLPFALLAGSDESSGVHICISKKKKNTFFSIYIGLSCA
jgi:hypothetical protein